MYFFSHNPFLNRVIRLNDETYMRLALQMAEQTLGQTGTNPAVGCVAVKDGRIVGLGAHLRMGGAHAEIHALDMAGAEAEGCTVYVTLEPCCHQGRTPPCCDRLIRDRVRRVVIAAMDPNPLVSGKGAARLRDSGIQVETGLLGDEAARLNEMYSKYIVERRPFVSLKTASTLDGKIASKTGDSRWITGESARACVHELRRRHQAVMVGVGTVICDDPLLTARLPVPAVQPLRIVVDSRLRTPESAQVIRDRGTGTVILTTEQAPSDRRRLFEQLGVEAIACGRGPQVDLPLAVELLGRRGIGSILLEGGGRLNGSMLSCRLIDKAYLFYSAKWIGGAEAPGMLQFPGFERMEQAIVLERTKVDMFEQDFCVTGYPRYGKEED